MEASLDVPSGAIAFRELFEDDPSEPVVWVQPGMYRVRVYYGNLSRAAWGGDDDYYRFVMWPNELYEAPVVLHISHPAMSHY